MPEQEEVQREHRRPAGPVAGLLVLDHCQDSRPEWRRELAAAAAAAVAESWERWVAVVARLPVPSSLFRSILPSPRNSVRF